MADEKLNPGQGEQIKLDISGESPGPDLTGEGPPAPEPGDVVVDTQSRVVTKAGEVVPLTAKEYNLLMLFLQNKNIALFRETIYERVWENEYMGDSRTVDLHVQRLRKKLGWQERIAAVYKVGYRLEVREE